MRPLQLIWDPGLGFAKDTDHNLDLLRGLGTLAVEGFPLLVGPSRKRFIGAVLNEPRPRARLWGTAAVCSQAIAQGPASCECTTSGQSCRLPGWPMLCGANQPSVTPSIRSSIS